MNVENSSRGITAFVKDPSRSVLREKLLEHLFLAELLQEAWVQGLDLSVLRAEVDVWGYDLVLKAESAERFVQLKSGAAGRSITVSRSLGRTPGACIVRMEPRSDGADRRISLVYRFAGAGPSEPLGLDGAPVAKQLRYNRDGVKSPRESHVKLGPRRFEGPLTIAELVRRLFPDPRHPM